MFSRLFTRRLPQRTLSSIPTIGIRRAPTTIILLRTISSSEPVAATERPLNEVYYHLVKTPASFLNRLKTDSVFAVSFLPEPPAVVKVDESKTVLGIIPALEGEQGEPGLNDFVPNPLFLRLMHETVKNALKEGVDETVAAEALQRKSGWMHIQDGRNIPALGRVGDPDDILASVMVENGKILPETYQVMPSYRIFTADGPPRLSLGLARRLEEALQKQLRLEIDN